MPKIKIITNDIFTQDIKDLTKDSHKEAEQQVFVQKMVEGDISPNQYYNFLLNKLLIYSELEEQFKKQGLLLDKSLETLPRASLMASDCESLAQNELKGKNDTTIMRSAVSYAKHFNSLNNPDLLLAHMYVNYLGDLYGGQMIASKLSYPKTHLDFENKSDLIKSIRDKIELAREREPFNFVHEVHTAFHYNTSLFKELAKHHGL